MNLFPHPDNLKILGKHFCLEYQALLFSDEQQNPYIALTKKENYAIVQEILKHHFQSIPKLHLITQKTFYRYAKFLNFQEMQQKIQHNIQELFHFILQQAIIFEASDIHLESFMDKGYLRFRIHGDLEIVSYFSNEIFKTLCSKIKLESKLDITNTQQSKDSRYSATFHQITYDFRIAYIPLYQGELLTIRIFYKNKDNLSLQDLHITPKHLNLICHAIKNPYGIFLVTGPTGSGKTTTLYAILEYLKKENKKIITLEDPPEYKMHFASQVKISSENGFDFQDALKAILRHDPDIIMVGEIRDKTTLNLAFRAALTGHLVLATLHSNDCISTLQRIRNMGLDKQEILSSLLLIISQRLYKKPCPYCKNLPQKGCQKCSMQGILGREIATEVLLLDKNVKRAIRNETLEDYLENINFEDLQANLNYKIQQGEIIELDYE
ncbi:Flp pilus assembly complex ATPase component TadA [Helicobacter sp. faydin-H20]|uniref:GspE/PulE family protein n=1 Tax=Helicobacter anatolicus TaxID=2905874 RepID=UPI001E3FE358|nr:ATPase, T2SS/T4P/T4SS family [Helicobacter anatolicus]MCE3037183.1 Flp pilus assembly complex ATPase component TadA [Helicobacter anatolicus]